MLVPSIPNATPSRAEPEAGMLVPDYREWARFVWLSLQRLGVYSADLDDVCQDVLVVVHKRLVTFRKGHSIHAWLFGICVRVAANHRRRAYLRREEARGSLSEDHHAAAADTRSEPERQVLARERVMQAELILSRLSLVKRAVFVMSEVEEMTCEQIAKELGLPTGTIYSRLHSARKFFAEEALKRKRRDERRAS